MPPCLIEICKVIIFKGFFPLVREALYAWRDFFSLMQEILHAWENSVQAGDSLSMRESWKPCRREKKCNFQTQFVQLPGFCQHFTENPFFISNKHGKILTSIMSIPPTFPLFFYHVYDKILAIIMSIPPTFNVLMNLPMQSSQTIINL